MNTIQKRILDLVQPENVPKVYAVEGDSGSRTLEVELHCGGEPWPVPEGASLAVRYRKSDGTGGVYDTLPDGTRAWSAQGNRLQIALAPQVCTAPGKVVLELTLMDGESQLSTFRLGLLVAGQLPEGLASEDYTNLASWLTENGRGPQGQPGEQGVPGPAPILSVGAVTTLMPGSQASVEMTGTPEAPVLHFGIPRGADGSGSGGAGTPGRDGVGIATVVQTTTSNADGGINVMTVTKTDGTTSTFQVKNGARGSAGARGAAGPAGQDGRTPVRGTDYWTESDIAQIKSYVDNAILGGAW